MIPRVLASRGLLSASLSSYVFDVIWVFSPPLSALIITGVTSGRAGVRARLSRYGIWRVGLGWYGVALLLPGLVCLGAFIFSTLLRKTGPDLPSLPVVVSTFVGSLIVNYVFNQEEVGWRGFALPRMQARWSALQSSLILGVIWGLWHLPKFLVRGAVEEKNPFLGFLTYVIALSIMLTWMFNSTRGSLLLSQLFHASIDAWVATLPVFPSSTGGDTTAFWIFVVLVWLIAIGLIAAYGSARLSRQPSQQVAE